MDVKSPNRESQVIWKDQEGIPFKNTLKQKKPIFSDELF